MAEDRWLTTLPESRQRELLAKHRAFWRREPGSEALIGFAPKSHVFPLHHLPLRHEGPLTTEMLTRDVIQADTRYRPRFRDGDDLLPAKIPMEPLSWAEAYVGSRVLVSSKAGTVWAEPDEEIPQDLQAVKQRLQPVWLEKLAEITRANVQAAGEEILVAETLLRGPADCIESLIGAERLCLWLYDRPELLSAMADWLADRVVDLYRRQLAIIPRFHGGTINRYRLWGPGDNIVTQADVVNVMSPEHFREIFVPSYQKLARHFDTVTMHFHSSACQHVEALLDMEELAAIEWAMDPNGPTLEAMLPRFARILESKCLILMNIHTNEQTAMLLDRLPHEGLCVIQRADF